jgi:predicted nucleotidyltransferase
MWMQAGDDEMRLSDLERRALAHALRDLDCRVEMFGSRIDDEARGGDIDLLVFAPALAAEDRLRLSLRVAVAFRSVCDEKIDVHVLDPHDLTATERAFLGVIRSEPLHRGSLVGG